MRRMLGKIGVTVAILAVVAIFTAPANAGHKSFVGPADDPFFVDLGAVFDGVNIDRPGRPTIGLGN
ncbi:MAG TPA: DUF4331 family protein [Gaiellaceae bacterium]|nr:DUF4331 family protein [Gaiellaceae bacterium]